MVITKVAFPSECERKPSRKSLRRPDNGGRWRKFDNNDKAIIAALFRSEWKRNEAIFFYHTTYLDSEATEHMVMDNTVLFMNKKSSSASIWTPSG